MRSLTVRQVYTFQKRRNEHDKDVAVREACIWKIKHLCFGMSDALFNDMNNAKGKAVMKDYSICQHCFREIEQVGEILVGYRLLECAICGETVYEPMEECSPEIVSAKSAFDALLLDQEKRNRAEQELLLWTTLRRNGWSVSGSAMCLGVTKVWLHRVLRIERYPALSKAWRRRRPSKGRRPVSDGPGKRASL